MIIIIINPIGPNAIVKKHYFSGTQQIFTTAIEPALSRSYIGKFSYWNMRTHVHSCCTLILKGGLRSILKF